QVESPTHKPKQNGDVCGWYDECDTRNRMVCHRFRCSCADGYFWRRSTNQCERDGQTTLKSYAISGAVVALVTFIICVLGFVVFRYYKRCTASRRDLDRVCTFRSLHQVLIKLNASPNFR